MGLQYGYCKINTISRFLSLKIDAYQLSIEIDEIHAVNMNS